MATPYEHGISTVGARLEHIRECANQIRLKRSMATPYEHGISTVGARLEHIRECANQIGLTV